MKAYSEDLRSRIVAVVDQGEPQAEIVATSSMNAAQLRIQHDLARFAFAAGHGRSSHQ
jgi:hypothetical protein